MARKTEKGSANLEKYRGKRDFSRTPEPAGRSEQSATGRMFVIQKHAARRLHYDFRLELDGVLKSWAVPKGPSLDPGEKRLAVHVEDHPVEYGSFEGIIPEGEYGGGTVMLWDRGEWIPEGDPRKGYEKGHLTFHLRGKKLEGNWTLARMGGKSSDGKDWLLIKKSDVGDAARELSPEEDDQSVVTGRTMEEIASARDRIWGPEGEAVPETSNGRTKTPVEIPDPSSLPGARKGKAPEYLRPQLATLVDEVPQGEDWLHEIKLDGYRMTCSLHKGKARLWTRNGNDWSDKFPALTTAAEKSGISEGIIDGEVVVLDPEGISDFQALQNHLQGIGSGILVYYVFDIPFYGGYDLTRTPLAERKEFLRRLLESRQSGAEGVLRYSDHIQGQGKVVLRNACRFALEGIVSKRADSFYSSRRSGAWLKVKCIQRQEFVIGGYSEPGGARAAFGSLLLGYYDREGRLVYAGRVGTGFNDRTLKTLGDRLKKLSRKDSPFHRIPSGEGKGVHWTEPELVAEVEFGSWTRDGRLRHPSFKGLREDRSPRDVVREESLPPPGPGGDKEERVGSADGPPGGRVDRDEFAGVRLSNPDRILYPEQGVTKRALARYYEWVGEKILPFVAGRPLTVVRCPQGRHRKCFYQKHVNESLPESIRGISVTEKEGEGLYILIDDLKGLLSLVQLGVLELHPWGSREDRLEYPDQVIFDLDPAPDVAWEEVVRGAREIRVLLRELKLESFVKTTGGKGLHVVAPLSRRQSWEEVKAFARAVAEEMVSESPRRYIATMSKARRGGKIFIDYLRNGRGATSIAPYSTRARAGAPVAVPLAWDELSPDLDPLSFSIQTLPELIEGSQDPWKDIFSIRQSITRAVRARFGI